MIRISKGLKNGIKSFVISLFVVVAAYCIGSLPALFFGVYEQFKMYFNLVMFWGIASALFVCWLIILYLVLRELFYNYVEIDENVRFFVLDQDKSALSSKKC